MKLTPRLLEGEREVAAVGESFGVLSQVRAWPSLG